MWLRLVCLKHLEVFTLNMLKSSCHVIEPGSRNFQEPARCNRWDKYSVTSNAQVQLLDGMVIIKTCARTRSCDDEDTSSKWSTMTAVLHHN